MYSFDELISINNRKPLIGMKAESLIRLREGGFNVPDGSVVTAGELVTTETLAAYADENTEYAVRSSCTSEDLTFSSFAGQYDTFLNIKGHANLLASIKKCVHSIHNERVSAYAKHSNIDISSSKMAVIVQRMVNSEKSGVAFSIDSVNGLDKVILIEAVSGLGEQLVSGHVTPDTYFYNWYDEEFTAYKGGVLTREEVKKLAGIVLEIQVYYGFPVDVEWAITGDEVHILQSRPITAISYKSIPNEWTTADFRDGGVSSAACKTLMASLYGLVFNSSFLDSLKTIKLLPKNNNDSIYEIFFARPYWCLTAEKNCFSKLPGFVEREIDADMGVAPAYKGDGIVTKTNLKSLWNGLNALTAIAGHIKSMERKTSERKADLLRRFERIERINLTDKSADELHELWVKFIKNDYFISEYIYFSYIFCNMILSSRFKDKIKSERIFKEAEYIPEIMNLMTGLSDLSHMRPVYEMWDMSRHTYSKAEFDRFIEKYKHHSQHELDISYPNWDEMPDIVCGIIADFRGLGDEQAPKALSQKQTKKYFDTLTGVPKRLRRDIERLRGFLWWREEFRDISSRFYYLIRRLTLALGKAWKSEGIINSEDDIFFLTVSDIEKKITENALKNKKYYLSFINFKNPHELGNRHITRETKIDGTQILKGVPCSGETVTAEARVIKDIHDAGRLKQGDILVTKCTDPAWTAIFSKISGVITETGGMLSHAAVVSREYGMACILLVKNATDVIQDGDVITMDCKTGEIYSKPYSGARQAR